MCPKTFVLLIISEKFYMALVALKGFSNLLWYLSLADIVETKSKILIFYIVMVHHFKYIEEFYKRCSGP